MSETIITEQEMCGHPCDDYLAGLGCRCNGQQPAPYDREDESDEQAPEQFYTEWCELGEHAQCDEDEVCDCGCHAPF